MGCFGFFVGGGEGRCECVGVVEGFRQFGGDDEGVMGLLFLLILFGQGEVEVGKWGVEVRSGFGRSGGQDIPSDLKVSRAFGHSMRPPRVEGSGAGAAEDTEGESPKITQEPQGPRIQKGLLRV